jgi:hypothetical protein
LFLFIFPSPYFYARSFDNPASLTGLFAMLNSHAPVLVGLLSGSGPYFDVLIA